jgi:hypothetical protein
MMGPVWGEEYQGLYKQLRRGKDQGLIYDHIANLWSDKLVDKLWRYSRKALYKDKVIAVYGADIFYGFLASEKCTHIYESHLICFILYWNDSSLNEKVWVKYKPYSRKNDRQGDSFVSHPKETL